jgi:hypothetical protein
VLSPGSNNGKVHQSNNSIALANAQNENGSAQLHGQILHPARAAE